MIDKQKLRKFREEINHILWADWDPIGIKTISQILYEKELITEDHGFEGNGEYSRYADTICSRLWNNNENKQAILDYLFLIETETMGLGTGTSNKKKIDEKNAPIVEKIFKVFSTYR